MEQGSDDDVNEEQDPVLRLAERVLEREPVAVLQPRGQNHAQGRIADGVTEHACERVAYPGLADLRRDPADGRGHELARPAPSSGIGPNASRRQSTISSPFDGQRR
ncbi:hypothetical protein GCM10020219_041050 [Nonomuraea dietziae]